MKKKWLWVLDPWQTLDHENDTSLRLIQAATEHEKIQSVICTIADLSFTDKQGLRIQEKHKLTEFSRVFYRVDPPVNLAYLHGLSLLQLQLDRMPKKTHPRFSTPIEFILKNHEKSVALNLGLAPSTLISSQVKTLLQFTKRLPDQEMIVKPIHSAQSKDVYKIKLRNQCFSKNDLLTLNTLTQNETHPIVAQEFLKKIITGETRLWFCEGILIAAVKKVPHENQFKINMDGGSTLEPHILNAKEIKVSKALSKHLKKEKIDLAAIDLIDGYVTDYNYTSPGLLTGLEKTLKKDLAAGIVRRLARTRR